MMTKSDANIFCVTGHLFGKFTGLRWIPRTQRPVSRSFHVFVDLRPKKNGWVNNCDAGYLRHIRPHFDVTVMTSVEAEDIYLVK